jgi:hypothetical protein
MGVGILCFYYKTLFLKAKNIIKLIGSAMKAKINPDKAGTIIPDVIQVIVPIVRFFVAHKTTKLINTVINKLITVAKVDVSISTHFPSL